jgi:hypothetical protein
MLPQLTAVLTPEQHGALDEVYRATRDVRVRTRVQHACPARVSRWCCSPSSSA